MIIKNDREGREGGGGGKQVHEGFPLVERNTHRFATIQRFALKPSNYATSFFSFPIVVRSVVGAR